MLATLPDRARGVNANGLIDAISRIDELASLEVFAETAAGLVGSAASAHREGSQMKRLCAFACLALLLSLLAVSADAAEKVKGTVKEIDQKARTIKFAAEGTGKEDVLTVDNAVDLKAVKSNMKAQVTVDGGVVKEIRPEARRSAAGY